MIWIVLLSVCFLAYSNGANDNFKGVASLYASRVASYERALALATTTTLAGAITALWFGQALAAKFSGRGIVPDALTGEASFAAAVATGAGLTVILATFTGFPVSTTHALTGALIGAGSAASGFGALNLAALGKGFVLPLLLSPVAAVVIVLILQLVLSRISIPSGANGKIQSVSAGVVCLARGLNDAPKIAAMMLGVKALAPDAGYLLVAAAMGIGGWLHSRRIANTMGHRMTKSINAADGLAANLTTAVLVLAASFLGLPVSTTHVSVGSLFGIGIRNRNANWGVMGGILLSWVLTLPIAGVLAFFMALLFKRR